jgi:hypothetical protein
MRRWFLLLLFWSGRFGVLDAARWIAGHVDSAHILAYIQREFPDINFSHLEAEYAIDRLWEMYLMATNNDSTPEGLGQLYEKVKDHFRVEHISLIPEEEWTDYVFELRKSDQFFLKPYAVTLHLKEATSMEIDVAFILRDN